MLWWLGVVLLACGLVLSASGLYAATGRGLGVPRKRASSCSTPSSGSIECRVLHQARSLRTHSRRTGGIVWAASVALADRGGASRIAAGAVFLGRQRAGVRAWRPWSRGTGHASEYYEIFSRVFTAQGRPFHPWNPPVHRTEVTS
ncbi:hypothetical protein ACU686_09305 [Yinghuangia aomiensis]